jgi:hypothetical protein
MKLRESPSSRLNFMIATLPDPTHTHFPLQFDRVSEAIQQGASDEGYVYDSSWLPWATKDKPYSSLQDQDVADSRKETQEEQPGILLFRKRLGAPPVQNGAASVNAAGREGLVVFIVGEEPTQGIHRDQFQNATAWIAALEANEVDRHRLPPIILGPTFSGSVYSLVDLVTDPEIEQSPAPGRSSGEERLRIYSGNITGNKAMGWTTSVLRAKADFASFQRSDGFLISRYCEYLTQSDFDLSRLAILSEDQTAYGSEVSRSRSIDLNDVVPRSDADSDPTESSDAGLTHCNLNLTSNGANAVNRNAIFHQPLRVYYPRDISGLRAAYQSESIFNASHSSKNGQRTLAPDIADPQTNQHDSIRVYSGDQKALSQEAVLQQIVSELRIHQSEYILLRSSNVLDQIFLSHYLRLGYPQGRIVILGADQLLRRESGAARLSGIMTLTTYPLLPWEPHWTQRFDDPTAHSHRVFAQDRSEGVYVATRALLHFPVTLERGQKCEAVVEHLLAAQYNIEPDAGDAGRDPICMCKQTNSSRVLFRARNAEKTLSELHLEFKSKGGNSYSLESIGVEQVKNNSSATQPTSSSFESSYPFPIPRLVGFVPVSQELNIPDYRAPFWIDPPGDAQDAPEQPVAWLSVLGRNDFWPLAVLTRKSGKNPDSTITKESISDGPADIQPQGSRHHTGRTFVSLFNVFRPRQYGSQNAADPGKNTAAGERSRGACPVIGIPRWFPMPVSVRIVLAALLIGCGFHFLCCFYPSVTQKPSHRAYFVCVHSRRLPYLSLMVLGSVTISATATVLAWGFGAMSPDGAPLANPSFWLLSQPFFWSAACLALAINISKQSYAPPAVPKARPADRTRALKWWSVQRRKQYLEVANTTDPKTLALWGSLIAFVLGTLTFYFAFYSLTERVLTVASRVPTYWRSMDFTDGVSPVMPLLAICVGAYLWFWYSLEGLALLGRDRPRLPLSKSLAIDVVDPSGAKEKKKDANLLRMFSDEGAAAPVEKLSGPFPVKVLQRAVLIFALQFLLVYFVGFRLPLYPIDVPLRSLGARAYSILICFLMDLLFSIMLANAWQLVSVWRELRRLLIHLDRLPLRRSMAAFPGVSWNSVWTISGNVLDMRYKLLTNELRCVGHLKNCLAARKPLTPGLDRRADAEMNSSIQEIQNNQVTFTQWYSDLYNAPDVLSKKSANGRPDILDQQPVEKVQKQLANFAGFLMARILVPAWQEEMGHPSETDAAEGKPSEGKDREDLTPVSQLDPYVRHAEQFVSYIYLGFIQNVLGRMRTLVMCILLLFIASTIAMSSYPFDPRPTISGAMVLLLVVLTAAIAFVYAQVHRDPILSFVTNTKPGELGGDFWLKLLGFGAGPVLGLLTTLFPQLTDFLFSWVQPSLTSIK